VIVAGSAMEATVAAAAEEVQEATFIVVAVAFALVHLVVMIAAMTAAALPVSPVETMTVVLVVVVVAVPPRPRLPRTIATSVLFLCSRSRSVPSSATSDPSSSLWVRLLRPRSSKIVLMDVPRGKFCSLLFAICPLIQ
jgi:hypothetical protein